VTGGHRRLANRSRHFRITARLLAVPAREQRPCRSRSWAVAHLAKRSRAITRHDERRAGVDCHVGGCIDHNRSAGSINRRT
jgi:hypothetical protein